MDIGANITALSAVTVFLIAGACAENVTEREPVNQPGAGEHAEQAIGTAGDVLEDVGEAVAEGAEDVANEIGAAVQEELDDLNALGMTMRNIINEEVRTSAGGVAARVDDILLDERGRPILAVLKEGGFFGVGEDTVVVAFQRLTMVQNPDGELSIKVTLSEEEIEKLGDGVQFLPVDFSVGGEIDTALISGKKLLGVVVYNSENEKVADIYDIILGSNRKINRIVVSTGGLGEIGDRLTAVPWNMFALAAERDSMKTTSAAIDFDALPTFDYKGFAE
ncbi:MAG: hypothetical protein HKN14_09585 [Marinicaulis sp.]|nr:hypothetical protein [Marinicaulis sp.]